MDLGLWWGNSIEIEFPPSLVSPPPNLFTDHQLYRFLVHSPSVRKAILDAVRAVSSSSCRLVFVHHTLLLIPFGLTAYSTDDDFLVMLRDRLLIGPPFSPFS